MPLTKDQIQHLNSRIAAAHNNRRWPAAEKKPAAVAAAEKLVAEYAAKRDAQAEDRRAALDAHRNAAAEAVLSGDWPSALAAVKKFENLSI